MFSFLVASSRARNFFRMNLLNKHKIRINSRANMTKFKIVRILPFECAKVSHHGSCQNFLIYAYCLINELSVINMMMRTYWFCHNFVVSLIMKICCSVKF